MYILSIIVGVVASLVPIIKIVMNAIEIENNRDIIAEINKAKRNLKSSHNRQQKVKVTH